MPVAACARFADANWAGVGSMPTGLAPRLASHAEMYAVPQPSSITSKPSTMPSGEFREASLTLKTPLVIYSSRHSLSARSSVCSAFIRVQALMLPATASGSGVVRQLVTLGWLHPGSVAARSLCRWYRDEGAVLTYRGGSTSSMPIATTPRASRSGG